jgi:hypothetical protein
MGGCANHPLDCGLGIQHPDCGPGTAGYADAADFAKVDDAQCQSYGLKPGTEPYADCRLKLNEEHRSKGPLQ